MADAVAAGQPITLALKPMPKNDRYGGVTADKRGRVTEFGLETKARSLINGGCYLVDSQALTDPLRDFPERFSLELDFLAPMAREGKIAPSIQNATFLDIGIPDDYATASRILVKDNL